MTYRGNVIDVKICRLSRCLNPENQNVAIYMALVLKSHKGHKTAKISHKLRRFPARSPHHYRSPYPRKFDLLKKFSTAVFYPRSLRKYFVLVFLLSLLQQSSCNDNGGNKSFYMTRIAQTMTATMMMISSAMKRLQ